MRIVIAASEAVPYIKTGGLADVTGALFKEFRKMGKEVLLFLPLYKKIKENFHIEDTGIRIKVRVGGRTNKAGIYSNGTSSYFLRCDGFFDRTEPYGTPEGDYPDNAARFVFFSRGVIEACKALKFKPDIIHCNDWQTGLVSLYLKTIYKPDRFFAKTVTLLTIHNLGYQGIFPASEMPLTNLGWNMFTPEGIEFYGMLNFLKAGLISADILNTVSRTYSGEILTSEFGFGLDGVLRKRAEDLYGIVNGIDYEEWNPSKDKFITEGYSHKDITGKAVCKRDLLGTVFKITRRTDAERIPVIGVIGRLSEQKGLDLILQSVPALMSFRIKLVILGKGDDAFQKSFLEVGSKYREKISVTIGFDESFAHRIYAGSDFFLMPSKYEPCGLGQLIALRYGCIPISRRIGGPADTIEDYEHLSAKGTGFLFTDYSPYAMQDAIKRAFCVYTDSNKISEMRVEGMKVDFSWRKSAEKYLELYGIAIKKRVVKSGLSRRYLSL